MIIMMSRHVVDNVDILSTGVHVRMDALFILHMPRRCSH